MNQTPFYTNSMSIKWSALSFNDDEVKTCGFSRAQMGSIHPLGRMDATRQIAHRILQNECVYVCSADQLLLFPLRKGYYPFSVLS